MKKHWDSFIWGKRDYTQAPISKVNHKIQIGQTGQDDYKNQAFKDLTIYDSNIDFSDFSESKHMKTIFYDVVLSHSNFTDIVAPFARFNYCIFDSIDFSGSNLYGVNFDLSRFERVNFTNCDLTKASFVKVDFGIVDFTNANLEDSIFIKPYENYIFRATNFMNTNLVGSNIVENIGSNVIFNNVIQGIRDPLVLPKFDEKSLISILDHIDAVNNQCLNLSIVTNNLPYGDEKSLKLISNLKSQLDVFQLITNTQEDNFTDQLNIAGDNINIEEY